MMEDDSKINQTKKVKGNGADKVRLEKAFGEKSTWQRTRTSENSFGLEQSLLIK